LKEWWLGDRKNRNSRRTSCSTLLWEIAKNLEKIADFDIGETKEET
jgi:hypothetical protein